jgi:hypothetical protein
MLLWIFISFILGAVTRLPSIHRLNILFLPCIFFIAIGVFQLKSKKSIILIISLYLISFGFFIYNYNNRMPGFMNPDFEIAIKQAAQITNGTICIMPEINMPYIHVLFDNLIDPNIFIKTVKYVNPGGEFQEVSSFDRYVFGMANCLNASEISAYVLDTSQAYTINQTQTKTEEHGAISVVWKTL